MEFFASPKKMNGYSNYLNDNQTSVNRISEIRWLK